MKRIEMALDKTDTSSDFVVVAPEGESRPGSSSSVGGFELVSSRPGSSMAGEGMGVSTLEASVVAVGPPRPPLPVGIGFVPVSEEEDLPEDHRIKKAEEAIEDRERTKSESELSDLGYSVESLNSSWEAASSSPGTSRKLGSIKPKVKLTNGEAAQVMAKALSALGSVADASDVKVYTKGVEKLTNELNARQDEGEALPHADRMQARQLVGTIFGGVAHIVSKIDNPRKKNKVQQEVDMAIVLLQEAGLFPVVEKGQQR